MGILAPLLGHLWPFLAMGVMALGIWGLFEQHKADALKHANDQAVIEQNLKDRAESAKQIGILETKLANIDTRTQPIIQHVLAQPSTSGCGPTVGFALDSLRDDRSAGQKPAGPKPNKPTGMPVPLGPAKPGK